MNCHRARMALVERDLEQLTLGFERALDGHLAGCPDCREHAALERLLVDDLEALGRTALPYVDVRARVRQHIAGLPPVETLAVPQRQLAWASMAALVAAAVLVAGLRSEAARLAAGGGTAIDGARALWSAAGSTLVALKGLLVLPWRLLGALEQVLAPAFAIAGRLEPLAVAAVSLCLLSMMLTIAWVVGNDLRRSWRREG